MKPRQPSSESIDRIYDSTDKDYLDDVIGESSYCNDDECSCHQLANYAQERLSELNGDS